VTRWQLTLALLCLLPACATTRIYSGKAPGAVARNHDERWHSALFFGLLPLSRPYALDAVCPDGWAEIRMHQDPFTLLSSLITAFLYTPSRISIVCAQSTDEGPPALPNYPVPQAN
jgi:hypothetical protein